MMPPEGQIAKDGTGAHVLSSNQPETPHWKVWATKLKEEYRYLLCRMDEVEKRSKVVESTASGMKAAETEMKELSKAKSTLEIEVQELRKMFGQHHVQIQKDGEKTVGVQARLTSAETKYRRTESDLQRGLSEINSMKRKVETMELVLQSERGSERLAKKNDPNDIRALSVRLYSLESHASAEARRTATLQAKIVGLERAYQKLARKNRDLESENNQLTSPQWKDFPPFPTSDAMQRLPSSAPEDIQVPASLEQTGFDKRFLAGLATESPALDARNRRTVKPVPRSPPAVRRQNPTTAQRRKVTINTSKKRKRMSSSYVPAYANTQTRQTRSQVAKAKLQTDTTEVTQTHDVLDARQVPCERPSEFVANEASSPIKMTGDRTDDGTSPKSAIEHLTPKKKQRVNACQRCRSRRVRCDPVKPCRGCISVGAECCPSTSVSQRAREPMLAPPSQSHLRAGKVTKPARTDNVSTMTRQAQVAKAMNVAGPSKATYASRQKNPRKMMPQDDDLDTFVQNAWSDLLA